MTSIGLVPLLALAVVPPASAGVESPYAFRSRLTCVHGVDRRDMSLAASSDEFAFSEDRKSVV